MSRIHTYIEVTAECTEVKCQYINTDTLFLSFEKHYYEKFIDGSGVNSYL